MLVGVFRSELLLSRLGTIGCPHARGGVPPSISIGASRASRRCPHARGGVPLNNDLSALTLLRCPHARGGVPLR